MRVRTHFRCFWPCMDAGWHVIRGLLLDIFCTNMLFRSVLEKEVSWKLPKKRYDDKTRCEAVASGSSCSTICHVNEASRHVMILMHQQHRNEATA